MEMDQILKQVDWLDEERRKDKTRLGSLEERLNAVEGNVPPLAHQIRELSGEVTRLNAILGRMDHFDESMMQHRLEFKQQIEEVEQDIRQRIDEVEKVRRTELRGLDDSLVELRKELEPVPEIRRALKARVEEENRIQKMIDEVRGRIETVRRSEEEYTRTFKLLDDGRRQDAKRLTDLQGEVASLRKRMDEQRGQTELMSTTLRRMETRVNELAVRESERDEALTRFLEKQAMREVERERVWKDWQARFDVIEGQTVDVESNLQTLDSTHRAVKRTQETVDELAQKVERRISEATEIQRLSEERFRQEWVTFKADDQKRWTNYTLTQEEQRGENIRQNEKLVERMTLVEDSIQEIQDYLHQMSEQTEKRLQALLSAAHEWVTEYESVIGRRR